MCVWDVCVTLCVCVCVSLPFTMCVCSRHSSLPLRSAHHMATLWHKQGLGRDNTVSKTICSVGASETSWRTPKRKRHQHLALIIIESIATQSWNCHGNLMHQVAVTVSDDQSKLASKQASKPAVHRRCSGDSVRLHTGTESFIPRDT